MGIITKQCTGCRACEKLCSCGAISMAIDNEGFLYAKINEKLCVGCGLCKKSCPQNRDVVKSKPQKVLAIRLKDEKQLFRSASGGAFVGIAKAWIEEGGLVFGVIYDKEWNARHVCAETIEDLKNIQSSKYVQADTKDTFLKVKELLKAGKKVLYSGTGCQIAGLKAFLKKEYENLLTMDIICHGVNSPLLFKKYINWLEKREGANILLYNFRSKKGGWALNYEFNTTKNTKIHYCDIDPYYYCFLEGTAYRECCYTCKYCTPERTGDFTIGDYWGIEVEHPKFYSTKGVSCILINSDKGCGIWKKYKTFFYSIESSFEKVARHNGNLLAPTIRQDAIRNKIYVGINDSDSWFADTFASKFHPTEKAKIFDFLTPKIRLFLKKIKHW